MTGRLKHVFVTMAISLTVAGCVKDVILDAGDEPQVVVECILSDESVQTLYLVYTKSASRTEAPELKEAIAVLTDLTDEKEVGHFQRTPDGSWQLEYAAVPAHNYRLGVSVPGHEPIWAEQAMPESPGVEVGWHSWDPVEKENNVGYTFRLRNSKCPVWFYGVNYPTLDSHGEQAEYILTNSEAVDLFNIVDRGAFFVNGSNAWGDNNYGFKVTTYPVLRDVPRHKRYLRFPASENPPDTPFYVSGSFSGYTSDRKDFMHAELRPAKLHYFSASVDYDRFIRDSYQLLDLKVSTDMADIFVRDNVYSNIHGAIGLFGAKIERTLEWEGKDTWQASGYFLLAGFVSSFTYDESTHSFSRLREAMLNCRPFELLHYEYIRLRSEKEYGEYPDLLPDWSPELLPGFDYNENMVTRFYMETIEDQEHWDAYGLGGSSELDFSKKKVLICVVSYLNKLPILIAYGYPKKSELYNEWSVKEYSPFILVSTTPSTPNVENYQTLFRCALLIDKDDQIADNLWSYNSFTYDSVVNVPDKSLAESLAWNYP
jgi:hypothetical protein